MLNIVSVLVTKTNLMLCVLNVFVRSVILRRGAQRLEKRPYYLLRKMREPVNTSVDVYLYVRTLLVAVIPSFVNYSVPPLECDI